MMIAENVVQFLAVCKNRKDRTEMDGTMLNGR